MTNLVLVNDVGDFELLLLSLQFMLFVNQLLSQNSLLVVQVEED